MTVMRETPCPDPADGWKASLELGFARRGTKTILVHNRHQGPLRLQRPLYPEPEVCHALILHPPGGVAGGDQLSVTVDVKDDAATLITTPGAAKFYRSGGRVAGQTNLLRVARGGCLEWLPPETIIYPEAKAATTTRLELAVDAGFMGWEILCLGLPNCGQPFSGGRFIARLEIMRQDRPIFHDRLVIDGAGGLNRPTGLRGFPVSATFVATGVTIPMRDPLRALVDEKTEALWGLTLMDDLLVVRMLGHDSADVKYLFQQLWTWLRPNVFGREVCVPRIWGT
jgi:urease accessory protein